jgi:hypothetical protein
LGEIALAAVVIPTGAEIPRGISQYANTGIRTCRKAKRRAYNRNYLLKWLPLIAIVTLSVVIASWFAIITPVIFIIVIIFKKQQSVRKTEALQEVDT